MAPGFAVTVGDNGYPNGSQINYGDLQQKGADTSAIFGPSFWSGAGSTIPLFTAAGNHGLSGRATPTSRRGLRTRRSRAPAVGTRTTPTVVSTEAAPRTTRASGTPSTPGPRAVLRTRFGVGRHQSAGMRARTPTTPLRTSRPGRRNTTGYNTTCRLTRRGLKFALLALSASTRTTRTKIRTRSSRGRRSWKVCSGSTA